MKDRYCLNCGHRLKAGEDRCPKCSFDNSGEALEKMEIHSFKRLCYDELSLCREKRNRALSFVVVAIISLVISAVMLVLSFPYDVLRVRHFVPASAQFVFCVLFLALFLFFAGYSLAQWIPSIGKRKFFGNLLRKKK